MRVFFLVALLHILVPFVLLMAFSATFQFAFEAWISSSVWVPLSLLAAVLGIIWWLARELVEVFR